MREIRAPPLLATAAHLPRDHQFRHALVPRLPPQLAAMMKTNINVQELTVAALIEENREHIFHAAMFDPHTAAELDVHQIRAMTDELLTAHRDWLPGWTQ